MNRETEWLVKMGGKIVGPFSEKDLTSKLRSREIRVIDEAMRPFGRWVYIRDEARFAKVVEEIRRGQMSSRDTDATMTKTVDDVTYTPSHTLALTNVGQPDDLTEEIPQASVQEAMYQSFDRIDPVGSASDEAVGVDAYTYDEDSEIQAKAKASTRWVTVLTFVLIFLAVSFVLFNQFIAQPIQEKNLAIDYQRQAEHAMQVGDFELALERYRSVHEIWPDDRGVMLPLSLLEIQVGQQALVGARLLEDLNNWSGVEGKWLDVVKGLGALKSGQYNEAEESFEEALSKDSMFLPAIINLGVTAYYKSDLSKANNYFQLSLKDGSREGADLLVLVDSLIKTAKEKKDRTYLVEARRYLEGMGPVLVAYKEEVYVALARVEFLLGRPEMVLAQFRNFLDTSLGASRLYKPDLLIHADAIDWKKLNQWCLQTSQQMEPHPHLLTAEAKCLFLAGDFMGASRKIEAAVNQSPDDPVVQAVYADLLSNMSSFDKAKVSAEKAEELDSNGALDLPLVLQAQFCEEQKDYFCASNYWHELLKRNPNSDLALVGLAKGSFKEGRMNDADNYLARARKLSPKFRPMLELELEIKKQ